MKHTVFLQNANAVTEWEIPDLTRKEAETEAFEAARNANDGEMVFIVCANCYLNQDGYSPVGNAWIVPKQKTITKDQLHTIGRALYGSQWQTELAKNIINLDGLELDKRRVQQWACGARPVPSWILPELKTLAQKRMQEIGQINKDLLAL